MLFAVFRAEFLNHLLKALWRSAKFPTRRSEKWAS
jgi:hypothetical protein